MKPVQTSFQLVLGILIARSEGKVAREEKN